jgi:murein DD-endopeptidase MepM/ murein hydrolase activator NlpD
MTKYVFPFPKKDIPKGGEFGNTVLFDGSLRANPHRGVDGPPEFAIAVTDAVVVMNKWSTVLGNVIVIQDEKGTFWGYSHLRNAPALTIGTKVVAGEKLGIVGNTGTASHGRHLHFTCSNVLEGIFGGKVFDPFEILEKRMAVEAAKVAPVAKVSAPASKASASVAPSSAEEKALAARKANR